LQLPDIECSASEIGLKGRNSSQAKEIKEAVNPTRKGMKDRAGRLVEGSHLTFEEYSASLSRKIDTV
jgi:hypothetical protein